MGFDCTFQVEKKGIDKILFCDQYFWINLSKAILVSFWFSTVVKTSQKIFFSWNVICVMWINSRIRVSLLLKHLSRSLHIVKVRKSIKSNQGSTLNFSAELSNFFGCFFESKIIEVLLIYMLECFYFDKSKQNFFMNFLWVVPVDTALSYIPISPNLTVFDWSCFYNLLPSFFYFLQARIHFNYNGSIRKLVNFESKNWFNTVHAPS